MSIKIEPRPIVLGLDQRMYVEYFGEFADGGQFIIYRPLEGWEYKDFRVLIRQENAAEFVLHEIKSIRRFRDGGTTDIAVDVGAFHFPSPFSTSESATFSGERVSMYERRSS